MKFKNIKSNKILKDKIDFLYVCNYCDTKFNKKLPKDLDNTMVLCPECKAYLKKRDFIM